MVDTVIIDAGYNGLVTGIVLTKAGLNVLVLDHATWLGGQVAGAPGYNAAMRILNEWNPLR
ncbi:NAD(P)-binding protein [Vulcanisaeta souniana]|nr:NAD(P)-binding protein [Vulcanisaeta souniana]